MKVAGIFNAHDPDFLKKERTALKAGGGHRNRAIKGVLIVTFCSLQALPQDMDIPESGINTHTTGGGKNHVVAIFHNHFAA
jgi:hypothetical protein